MIHNDIEDIRKQSTQEEQYIFVFLLLFIAFFFLYFFFNDKAQRILFFSRPFSVCVWSVRQLGCRQSCHLTLHWQRVHSVPCLIQEEPLKREMLCSSVHVLVMSLRMVSAWQGSVTQRGQHSPSGTTVNSQSTSGHGRGQQSTCPCCGAGGRDNLRQRDERQRDKYSTATTRTHL